MGPQVTPLWQTPIVPLLYLLSAITIGYGVVLFESCVAASGYRRQIEMHILQPMAKVMLGVLAVYLAVRFGDLVVRGAIGNAFKPGLEAFVFWIETIFFVLPFVLIGTAGARRNPAKLFLAGISIMLGGVFLRINGFLIGYDTGPGWNYFPSIAEMLVTAGMFAVEVLGYIIITRRFPVLPREEAAAAH
jgi:Ni/Fe-hydrogenase subunit HybB-like protein